MEVLLLLGLALLSSLWMMFGPRKPCYPVRGRRRGGDLTPWDSISDWRVNETRYSFLPISVALVLNYAAGFTPPPLKRPFSVGVTRHNRKTGEYVTDLTLYTGPKGHERGAADRAHQRLPHGGAGARRTGAPGLIDRNTGGPGRRAARRPIAASAAACPRRVGAGPAPTPATTAYFVTPFSTQGGIRRCPCPAGTTRRWRRRSRCRAVPARRFRRGGG